VNELEVRKLSAVVPISEEMAAEVERLRAGINWALAATPEEMAAYQEQRRRERTAERAASEVRPLTLDRLIKDLGWSGAYALHFVQPYCTCSDSYDGWDYCQHAHDEGVIPE
jgi:hypothetical protein